MDHSSHNVLLLTYKEVEYFALCKPVAEENSTAFIGAIRIKKFLAIFIIIVLTRSTGTSFSCGQHLHFGTSMPLGGRPPHQVSFHSFHFSHVYGGVAKCGEPALQSISPGLSRADLPWSTIRRPTIGR